MKELNDTIIFAMWIGRLPTWSEEHASVCEKLQTGFPKQRKAMQSKAKQMQRKAKQRKA